MCVTAGVRVSPCECRCQRDSEESVRFLGAGVTGGGEPPYMGVGKLTLVPCESSMYVLLTRESSLQPHPCFLIK